MKCHCQPGPRPARIWPPHLLPGPIPMGLCWVLAYVAFVPTLSQSWFLFAPTQAFGEKKWQKRKTKRTTSPSMTVLLPKHWWVPKARCVLPSPCVLACAGVGGISSSDVPVLPGPVLCTCGHNGPPQGRVGSILPPSLPRPLSPIELWTVAEDKSCIHCTNRAPKQSTLSHSSLCVRTEGASIHGLCAGVCQQCRWRPGLLCGPVFLIDLSLCLLCSQGRSGEGQNVWKGLIIGSMHFAALSSDLLNLNCGPR